VSVPLFPRAIKIIGERFYIYASRKWAAASSGGGETLPGVEPGDLPTGQIVGTAIVSRRERANGKGHWHLSDVKRLDKPRKPKGRPQPMWFRSF